MNTAVRPIVHGMESSPVLQLIAIVAGVVGFGVVIATAFQIRSDLAEAQEERSLRLDNAIERRWDRLLRPASGNIGKGEALSFLVRQGVSVNGVDLSCEAVGAFATANSDCRRPPIYTEIVLRGRETNGLETIEDISFQQSKIDVFLVTSMELRGIDMRRSNVRGLELRNSRWSGRFGGARFEQVHLISSVFDSTDAELPLSLSGNISDSQINFLSQMKKGLEVYAWADHPPVRARGRVKLGNATLDLIKRVVDDETLAKITLCSPPKGNTGAYVPLGDRRKISRLSLLGRSPEYACESLSVAEAKAAFPDAYFTPD